jgi:ABC-type sugar transport system ATPase subunit
MSNVALPSSDLLSAQGAAGSAASVAIERLVKSFGQVEVISDLTVSFRAGAISVLLGSSGCGKTTILRCIAGLEEPSGGDIRIHDRTVFSSAKSINVPPERRDLGMVFQSYAIWPHMTVYENVALPLRAHDVPRSEAQVRWATASSCRWRRRSDANASWCWGTRPSPSASASACP